MPQMNEIYIQYPIERDLYLNFSMDENYIQYPNKRDLYSIPPKTRFIFNTQLNEIYIQYPRFIFYTPINGFIFNTPNKRDLYLIPQIKRTRFIFKITMNRTDFPNQCSIF